MVNRQGHYAILDIHKSKLNLAKWVRRGQGMRNTDEITKSLRGAYEFLFECAYCNFESGYYHKYLCNQPETVNNIYKLK